jgi:putative ABC transport system permease protein
MQTIPFSNLLYSLIPLVVVWVFYAKWIKNSKEIPLAVFRMVVQLLLIGYLLVFIFENKQGFFGALILTFMLIVASLITLRNQKKPSFKEYLLLLFSIGFSSLLNLGLIIFLILDIQSYEPSYIIPIAGMIFANSMNVLSLCTERFNKELLEHQSFEQARNSAFKAAMIPQINTLLAVGLVALPGMMTGQILSGVDPMIAVRYQMMIMSMILSSAGLSMIVYFIIKRRYNVE